MKRLIIRGEHILPAARLIFEGQDKYTEQQMVRWPELEITVQDDDSYAVWVNLLDDADLLQDRRHNHGLLDRLTDYVDEIILD